MKCPRNIHGQVVLHRKGCECATPTVQLKGGNVLLTPVQVDGKIIYVEVDAHFDKLFSRLCKEHQYIVLTCSTCKKVKK